MTQVDIEHAVATMLAERVHDCIAKKAPNETEDQTVERVESVLIDVMASAQIEILRIRTELLTQGYSDVENVNRATSALFRPRRICSITADKWCGRCKKRLFGTDSALDKHIEAVRQERPTRSVATATQPTAEPRFLRQQNKDKQ